MTEHEIMWSEEENLLSAECGCGWTTEVQYFPHQGLRAFKAIEDEAAEHVHLAKLAEGLDELDPFLARQFRAVNGLVDA